ncbi:uncharacterized protein N7473_004101 [Penicillium subrubescens]|jgi:hypothetical protein|uniref:Uncharacterized protein n=1 Tax=Penicillium subrubescens TaxID=1316194 RepID=A0A1Q5UIQ4_9EURO|nr:uncharacterized protein N7473_004101 [Penicillium subrubescens]KAJ5907185.1 hypothetical protein N7473_004101 [Penicillium subrubescens]OKP12342.1 hypothetical protein PENSUB_2078 [Penicillium subrubescens]
MSVPAVLVASASSELLLDRRWRRRELGGRGVRPAMEGGCEVEGPPRYSEEGGKCSELLVAAAAAEEE